MKIVVGLVCMPRNDNLLDIYPDLFASLKRNRNRDFFLIITLALSEHIKLHPSKYYKTNEIVICDFKENIYDVVKSRVSEESDIIFIPHKYELEYSYVEKNTLNKKSAFIIWHLLIN